MRFALLLGGLAHAYAWQVFPRSGTVWTLTGGLYTMGLLFLVGVAYPAARPVCLLLGFFQLAVVGCSTAFLIRPWATIPGESCTAVAGLPLGVLGAVPALMLALKTKKQEGPSDG